MKKFLSMLLITSIVISSSSFSFALIQNEQPSINGRTTIGDYQYEVLQKGSKIIVNEYDNTTLISTTINEMDNETITKEIYNENNDVIDFETFQKEDLVSEEDLEYFLTTDTEKAESNMLAAASWKTYGKYSLQLKNVITKDTKTHAALLKYYVESTDNDSYTVNAAKGRALSAVISLVGGFLAGVITGGASLAAQVAAALLTTAGSYAVDGIIQVAFTETVSAKITYTTTQYTDISGGGFGTTFPGKKARITTRSSKYYDQTFYEGDAPERYKENAKRACSVTYSGGDNYTFDKMLSFNAY